jgi:predicted RNA-binding protein with PIN domain
MARWLVDGMNVIGSRPDGWWRDRPRAMVDLVESLEAWAAGGDPVTVVFDGDPLPGTPPSDTGLEVVFAGRGRTADDVIAARVADDPDPASLVVVTSDGELARRVEAQGSRLLGAGTFRRRLDT